MKLPHQHGEGEDNALLQEQLDRVDYFQTVAEVFKQLDDTTRIRICANLMEDAARKTAGVQSATVNFMTQKMIVEFAEGQEPKAVMEKTLSAKRAKCISVWAKVMNNRKEHILWMK